MNPLQRMEQHKASFTQNDMTIYNTIINDPSMVVYMTTSVLAQECGVSQPALSRFVRTLGYARYQDFRSELIAWLALQNEQDAQGSEHLSYFNTLYALLQAAEETLTAPFLTELADYIGGFDRVFASGIGKSFHPAQLMETLMRKNRCQINAIASDYIAEVADAMRESDLLILFSARGGEPITRDAMDTAGKLMMVTANPHPVAEAQLDRLVVLPYTTASPETSPVSPILFDVFAELMVQYLSKREEADRGE